MPIVTPPLPANRQTWRLLVPLALIVALLTVGTAGYVAIEGWSVADALYMTVITVSTVGYSEIHPLSGAGRAFTVALIIGGVGTLFYALTTAVAWIVEHHMGHEFVQQQVRRRARSLRDHVIVCGYGRVGRSAARELREERVPLIVVEQDEGRAEQATSEGFLTLQGDAAQDETLRAAGIERARGLLVAVDDDARSVFITISGRALNSTIAIVARAATAETEAKLRYAGADRVVSPFALSGQRMAALITRPNVVDLVETAMSRGDIKYAIEEFVLAEDSPFVGRALAELDLRERTGATILALLKRDGEIVTSPAGDTRLAAGDTLIAIGTREQLQRPADVAREETR